MASDSEKPTGDRLGTFARVSGMASFLASFLIWGLIPAAYVARRLDRPSLVEATGITMGTIWIASYLLAMESGMLFVRREAVRQGERRMGPLRWVFAAKLNFTIQTALMAALFLSGWLPR